MWTAIRCWLRALESNLFRHCSISRTAKCGIKRSALSANEQLFRSWRNSLCPHKGNAALESPFTNQHVCQMPQTKPMNAMIPERAPNAEAPRLRAGRSLHHMTFFCEAKEAGHVFLVGDFNHWNSTATPMNRMPDGRWSVSVELPHGHQHCRFLVDGEPQLDPNASGIAHNDRNESVALIAVSWSVD